jgi:exodeoxyribonuclease V alpha subunit
MATKGKSDSFTAKVKKVKEHNSSFFTITLEKEDDNGVLTDIKASGFISTITIYKGQTLEVSGIWKYSDKYGEQFSIDKAEEPKLNKIESTRAFLKSGLVKGIGPKTADVIVETFGEDTIEVLDENPSRLLEVPRIGRKTLEKIKLSWEETRSGPKMIEEIMLLGFPENEATRIYKGYKKQSLIRAKETPYAMLSHIYGLKFDMVDFVALKNGMEETNPERIRVCLDDILSNEENDTGNTIFEKDYIIKKLKIRLRLKDQSLNLVEDAVQILEESKKFKTIMKQVLDENGESYFETYIQRYEIHQKEKEIVFFIQSLLNFPTHEVYKIKEAIDRTSELALTDEQKQAMVESLIEKVNIINGGPGVGKTTALKSLVKIFKESGYSVLLCAPTGRAAKRMSESAGMEAKTIHRALEYNPMTNSFNKNTQDKLEYDVVIVDEFSMVDLHVMTDLIRAIKLDSHFIMLGDVDQLPSVGAGALLRDMIESGVLNVSKITKIQRQAAGSKIIKNAYKVNNGGMIEKQESSDEDFFYIPTDSDQKTLGIIGALVGTSTVKGKLETRFEFQPKTDVQILVPEHAGVLGTTNLNKFIQNLLNPMPEIQDLPYAFGDNNQSFRISDNIMQMKNDHENKIYNGDGGIVESVRYDGDGINILFQGRNIAMQYTAKELKDIKLAYAITIHKSQGSEYPVAIIPISQKDSFTLDRSLIYTAITRGKKKVIIIGSEEQIQKGILNVRSRQRKTNLLNLLREELKEDAKLRIQRKLKDLDMKIENKKEVVL